MISPLLRRFSFSACIELVNEMTISSRQTLLATWNILFSRTRIFGNSFGLISNQSERARKTWNERWTTLKFRHTRHEHKRVSCVRFCGPWISIGRSWLELGSIFLTRDRYFFCHLNFNDFELGSMAENPILVDELKYEKIFLLQQIQSLKNGAVVPLKQKLRVSALTFKDICVNNLSLDYNCVYELNEKIDCFNLSLSLSETRQKIVINTFIFALPKLFLVAASFCIYHVYTDEKSATPQRNQKLKTLVQWLLSERPLFFHRGGR